MDQLNNILLEGIVVKEPVALTEKSTVFSIENTYDNKMFSIDVFCYNKLGEKCLKTISGGMSVRVVGRLRQMTLENVLKEVVTSIVIVAEHIEYRKQNCFATKCNSVL